MCTKSQPASLQGDDMGTAGSGIITPSQFEDGAPSPTEVLLNPLDVSGILMYDTSTSLADFASFHPKE